MIDILALKCVKTFVQNSARILHFRKSVWICSSGKAVRFQEAVIIGEIFCKTKKVVELSHISLGSNSVGQVDLLVWKRSTTYFS